MKLIVEQGALAGQEFTLTRAPDAQTGQVFIGRGAQCDIVLQEQLVSREHACIQPGSQGWNLVDLGSTNGTFLNGQRLQAHQAYLLHPGDRVTIGSVSLVLRPDVAGATPGEPGPGAYGSAPGALPSASRRRGAARPALLIVGIFLVVVVLVGLVALLVFALQPKEEPAAPEAIDPLKQIGTALPIPTLLENIATVLPTQLEELMTALPVPTQIEDLATALPIPTELQPIATSILPSLPTGLPKLPSKATATPAPASVFLDGGVSP